MGQGGNRCEGRVSLPDGATRRASGRAAHINFLILYSGLMRQLQTTLFFEAARDPVLDAVEASRRNLLVAQRVGEKSYRFDIRLRGDDETPFFDD